MQNEIVEAVTLCYCGQGLMTCTFYNGLYYYIPVKGGERKFTNPGTISALPHEYREFAGQTEIVSHRHILGHFNTSLMNANKCSESPLLQEIGLKFSKGECDFSKLLKYSKIQKSNPPHRSGKLYLTYTQLEVKSNNGEITFAEAPL